MNQAPSQTCQDTRSQVLETISQLQERFNQVASYDRISEITKYSDELEDQVLVSVDSAIEHINLIKTKLLHQIKDYREETLGQAIVVARKRTKAQAIADLTAEVEEFSQKCAQVMDKDDPELNLEVFMTNYRQQQSMYMAKIKQLQQEMRDEVFRNRYMKFRKNPLFLLENERDNRSCYRRRRQDR